MDPPKNDLTEQEELQNSRRDPGSVHRHTDRKKTHF